MLNVASVTDIKRDFASHIEALQENGTLVVLRHNEPVAVVLSPEYFQDIQENYEDIVDALAALDDVRNGLDTDSAEDVFGELGI